MAHLVKMTWVHANPVIVVAKETTVQQMTLQNYIVPVQMTKGDASIGTIVGKDTAQEPVLLTHRMPMVPVRGTSIQSYIATTQMSKDGV